MDITISTAPLQLEIFGFGGVAADKNYVGTVFTLSGRLWEVVKANGIPNKGKNIWVYEKGDGVFAGVEVANRNDAVAAGLENKLIYLEKYAYYKHIGPYSLLKEAVKLMKEQIARSGYTAILPHIELYGHWDKDESKLETELFMNLQ